MGEKEKVMQLVDLCMDINAGPNTIFVAYAPHVNRIDVRVYEGEWKEGKELAFDDFIYTDIDTDEEFNNLIERLKGWL